MHGQQSFFEGNQPLKITKPIRLIALFAGIGAQAKALENLGVPFEHYRICEWDKYAVASYNAIHGTCFLTSDITKIHADDLCVCDTDCFTYIMTYSFPCTDLSSAGKMAGMSRDSGTRSGLLWQVERLLKEMKELPQILLMENVPEVVSDKNIHDFAEWILFLDSLGYMSKHKILNAKNYGVPQNRERCFMVSWLGDYYYDFPQPFPLTTRLMDVLEPEVDEKFYLSDQAIEGLVTAMSRDHKPTMIDYPQRERESHQRLTQSAEEPATGHHTSGIIVVGSLKPEKNCQDRVRVLSTEGVCQGLRATDYKDPPKIVASGIYLNATRKYQRGGAEKLEPDN